MDAPSCPGCQQRDETIADLRQRLAAREDRVRELEAQLRRNATNSSVPPSANPPGAPKPAPKKPTGRQSGGQPGHPAHLRRRLPPGRVQHTRDFIPSRYGFPEPPPWLSRLPGRSSLPFLRRVGGSRTSLGNPDDLTANALATQVSASS